MSIESTTGCPSFEALSAAYSAEEAPEVRAHLEGCARCREVLHDLDRLKAAGQALPWDPPDPSSEAERAAVLAERAIAARRVATRVHLARRVVGVAAAMAASWAIGYWVSGRSAPSDLPTAPLASTAPARSEPIELPGAPEPRAVVRGARGAQFVHERRNSGEERVQLSEGQLTLEVEPLRAGERFVVHTDDGDIETIGGVLEVTVVDGHLRSVAVISGRAEVRPKAGSAAPIAAGERWPLEVAVASAAPPSPSPEVQPAARPVELKSTSGADAPEAPKVVEAKVVEAKVVEAKVVEAKAPVSPPPQEAPTSTAEESPTPEIPVASSAEKSFAAGWDALLANDLDLAAQRFGELAGKSDPLAEDAGYWRSVALARAGRSADAERAMESYVTSYPSSSRVPEVSAMLGWSLLRRGERATAQRWLESARDHGSSAVKASAERGLVELGR